MGHCIRAVVGRRGDVKKLADDWIPAELIELPQDFGIVMLTDSLLDDVEELSGCGCEDMFPELDGFFAAVKELMEQYSFRTKLAWEPVQYFEMCRMYPNFGAEQGDFSPTYCMYFKKNQRSYAPKGGCRRRVERY